MGPGALGLRAGGKTRTGVSAPHERTRCRPFGTLVPPPRPLPGTSVLGYRMPPLRGWSLTPYAPDPCSSLFIGAGRHFAPWTPSGALRNDKVFRPGKRRPLPAPTIFLPFVRLHP